MATNTHRFEGEMDTDMFEALNEYIAKHPGTNKSIIFRKAMSLFLRAKREDNDIILRDKNDPSKVVQLVGI